ncbi:SCP2 sterol-binding domain-containing protein [Cognatishimia sp. F0-27]|uniref:SCP2 sterol-binding domain-containing protein n=1 Tax=Cognatishimia sp. F0-27 TaxID=2816855 RepID=UPI001D0C257A|nr:SCP2 sterol-binding domain-containing protein [Cognatishimia sp. F0-27]MCC1492467.1 SCP2 sterol-binding domain-containing protein [Cognatishimia sp. F0-27]
MDQYLDKILRGLQNKSFDGSLKFDCGPDGVIVLENGAADRTDRATDCTLSLTKDNLGKLLAGKLNPMTAVMMGKLRVTGDMTRALAFAKLLG